MNKKEEVITELSQQLISTKSTQRKAALQVLKRYDYAAVEDILLAALSVENDKYILHDFFEIFFENSSEELFYKLYFQAKSVDDSQKANQEKFKGIEDLLSRMSSLLAEIHNGKNPLDYYKIAEMQWNKDVSGKKKQEEQRRQQIQRFIKKTDSKEQKKEKEELTKFASISHAVGLILVVVIWFWMRADNIWPEKGTDNHEADAADAAEQYSEAIFLPEEPISVKGVVSDANTEFRQVMLQCENDRYMLTFPEDLKIPASGEELSCQIFVEDYIDGVYVAQVITLY